MTSEQRRRVLVAIEECNTYIAKEEPRSPELRPAEITKLLQFYYQHREKLKNMLVAD